jgi:hypothetical protein
MERLWLGELRRAHAIIHIISIPVISLQSPGCAQTHLPPLPRKPSSTCLRSQDSADGQWGKWGAHRCSSLVLHRLERAPDGYPRTQIV